MQQIGVKRSRDDLPIDFDLIEASRSIALASIRLARSRSKMAAVDTNEGAAASHVSRDDGDRDYDGGVAKDVDAGGAAREYKEVDSLHDSDSDDLDDDASDSADGEENVLVSFKSTSAPCMWGTACHATGCKFLHDIPANTADAPMMMNSATLCHHGEECHSKLCPFAHPNGKEGHWGSLKKEDLAIQMPRVQTLIRHRGGLVKTIKKRYEKKYQESISKPRLREILKKVTVIASIDSYGRDVWAKQKKRVLA